MSKGSRNRTADRQAYREGMDRIFGGRVFELRGGPYDGEIRAVEDVPFVVERALLHVQTEDGRPYIERGRYVPHLRDPDVLIFDGWDRP